MQVVQANLARGRSYGSFNGNFNPNGGSDRVPKRNVQSQFCLKIRHIA